MDAFTIQSIIARYERLLDDKGLPVMMFSSEWFTENEVEVG